MCDNNNTANYIGYSGGIVLSICLIPQIFKVYKTKQVDNISYIWQSDLNSTGFHANCN